MAGRFPGHSRRREAAQFLIHQRKQLRGRLAITLLDAREDLGEITHAE